MAFNNAIEARLIVAAQLDDAAILAYTCQNIDLGREESGYYAEAFGAPFETVANIDNPDDVERWRERVAASGPVETTGVSFIGAYELDDKGQPTTGLSALQGQLILSKDWQPHRPPRLCNDTEGHTPTRILNFYVRNKGRGIGNALLRVAAGLIHPEDEVTLGLDAPNHRSAALYARLGFRGDPTSARAASAGDLLSYDLSVPATILQARLGVEVLDQS